MSFKGIIYFIKEGDRDRVKIGKTKSPSSLLDRIKTHQCGNSDAMRIIALDHGYSREEKILHRLFREHKIPDGGTEFFYLSEQVAEYARNLHSNGFVYNILNKNEKLWHWASPEYGIDTDNREFAHSYEHNQAKLAIESCIKRFGFFHNDLVGMGTGHFIIQSSDEITFPITKKAFKEQRDEILATIPKHKVNSMKTGSQSKINIWGDREAAQSLADKSNIRWKELNKVAKIAEIKSQPVTDENWHSQWMKELELRLGDSDD